MKRKIRPVAAAAAVGALATVLAGAPAGAQIPDAPPLGLEIDPTEGPVGSTVHGQVNTDDVAEHCNTEPGEFVSQFVDPENPLGDETPYLAAALEYFESMPPDADIETDPHAWTTAVGLFFPIGLALDLGEGGELAEDAMEQTFVFAFADLETAAQIAPWGTFDRNTGEGSVDVPELDAGGHPVIAACVGIDTGSFTVDDFAAGVAAGQAYVEANFETPYPADPLGAGADEFAAAASEVAPVMLQEMIEIQGLGVDFYCVHDGDGECPTDEMPDPGDFGNGNGNGDAETPSAVGVVRDPSLTG